MVSWSPGRKALTILLFTAPTIVGILLFSVFPILLSFYVSFTNRNKTHPYPDCSVGLSGILDPLCWPQFRENAPRGLADPYQLQDPILKNYADLVGKLFTAEAVGALFVMSACFLPLVGAYYLNKQLDKQLSRPLPSEMVWLAAIGLGLVLAYALNVAEAARQLNNTGDFFVVVYRTLLFVILRVPFSFGLGLTLALILNSQHLPGRTFFRVVLFIPWAASSLAILMALVWQFFFREQGTINQFLGLFGFQYPAEGTLIYTFLQSINIKSFAWLNQPVTAFAAVIITDVWFSYPFFMISILGALQSVPADTYEAAEIDGASWWQQLTQITLPLIRPAILPATVLTSITAFQMFGTAYALTGGGPIEAVGKPGATEFVIVYAFKQIFQTQNYGKATAFSVILFVFLFAATLYSLRLTRITKGAYE